MYKQKLFKITVSFISIMVLLLGASTIYVTQFEKRSVQSKIVEIFLNAQGGKDIFTNREKLAEFMKEREKQNEKSYVIPNDVELISTVKEENISGMQVLSLNRKKGKNKMQILYLHGGAYINQPTNVHMTFLDKVASDTNAEITVPIYPKAPVHQFREAFEKVLPIYEELLTKTEPKNIVIMGDSAGGGFSLALSQMLLEKNLLQPGNIILLSPWLDITMKNPLIPTFEDKDPMLGAYGLIEIGKAWAGDTDPNNFMLSPINGPIKGLGNITIFVGTHELFLPDARKFRDMAKEEGIAINYHEYPKMNHVFPTFPIPEGKKVIEEIMNIINK